MPALRRAARNDLQLGLFSFDALRSPTEEASGAHTAGWRRLA